MVRTLVSTIGMGSVNLFFWWFTTVLAGGTVYFLLRLALSTHASAVSSELALQLSLVPTVSLTTAAGVSASS